MDTITNCLGQLTLLQSQLDNLERRKVELIGQLRDTGRLVGWEPVSWELIAKALGCSRQGAWQRYHWIDDRTDDE